MLPTCQEMQDAEERLFATGVKAETLMDAAGLGCARAIDHFFPEPGRATLFCGKGNNAGDALVIGRHLQDWGWTVDAVYSCETGEGSDLLRNKRADFESDDTPGGGPRILVDGLLGIGAGGPLRGKIGELAEQINTIRRAEHATVFAVDLPTGLGAENGVKADFTLSICEFKADLLEDSAIDRVGRLVKIELPELSGMLEPGGPSVADANTLRSWLTPRNFGDHKGSAGRVAIVAGSRGLTGAATLGGMGALHGGAGLTTIFAEGLIYDIVASSAPPEIMVRPTTDFSEVFDFNADVLAIGPGLGEKPPKDIRDLIFDDPRPAVIDADGLNLIAPKFPFDFGKKPRLLTPHPGEMARFFDPLETRLATAEKLTDETGAAVVFKGARSVVTAPGEAAIYNSTGHPGMATGGIGDVLTGLTAALITQKISSFRAGVLGSWLIGRAAEIATFERGESAESLTAGMVAECLGGAFESLKRGDF
ncbi:MAG: NAD(P)H-hydrate dehydratase [Verrucomicrobiales bacterium]|nr:NAD(P)H-hydrate dehydratase [Verrucomicrobiales bacterium]